MPSTIQETLFWKMKGQMRFYIYWKTLQVIFFHFWKESSTFKIKIKRILFYNTLKIWSAMIWDFVSPCFLSYLKITLSIQISNSFDFKIMERNWLFYCWRAANDCKLGDGYWAKDILLESVHLKDREKMEQKLLTATEGKLLKDLLFFNHKVYIVKLY